MKIGFLFGAGVSRSCGDCATDRLTEIVLSGKDVHRPSDAAYVVSADSQPGLGEREGLDRIRCFLAFLNAQVNGFFKQIGERKRVANYEDLYYLVAQLADADGEYENPAISEFLKVVETVFVIPTLPAICIFQSTDLFRETRRYIKEIVSHLLSKLEPTQEHLTQVIQAAADQSISRLEIFTLNHDRLIEHALQAAGISFSTGFARVSDDLLCWDPRAFARSRSKVRLIKLHGSVDWYSMRLSQRESSCTCVATNGDVGHARGPNGLAPTLCDDSSEILIGTFNKMLEYTSGIYADLFCAFRRTLWGLDRLVISGYSFGDKGVNASIDGWTRQDCRRRVLVIGPDKSDYRDTARGAILRLFKDCPNQIERRKVAFEEVTWQQIRNWSATVD